MVLKVLVPLGGIDPSSLGLFLVLFCVLSASYSSLGHKFQLILSTTYGREMNYVGFRVRPYLHHHLWDQDRVGELCSSQVVATMYSGVVACPAATCPPAQPPHHLNR
jgi:hypothetical protein